MVTQYPAKIDNNTTLLTIVDNQTSVNASPINILRDAIIKIQTELGIKPSSVYGDVASRLGVIENTVGNLQIIQIAQDIGGSLSHPLVIGIQGRPISTVTPNFNDALIWNGTSWSPASVAAATGGPAAGDLIGIYPSPTVAKIQGNPVKAQSLGSFQDGYIMTWKNSDNKLELLPNISAGDVIGITTANKVIGFVGQVTLEKYGAVEDGITNVLTAFDSAMTSGKDVLIGSYTYVTNNYLSGGLTTLGQSIIGTGGQSVLQNLTNQPIITIAADESQVSGLKVYGTFGAGSGNHGVDLGAYSKSIVSNVYAYETGGSGFHCTTGNVANMGPVLLGLRSFVAVNAAGFHTASGEYATVGISSFYGGTYGVHNDAGNTKLIGVSMELNDTGLFVNNNDSNDGHGIVIGCSMNHNTTHAVNIKPLVNGYGINVSHMYYGDILVTGKDGGHLTASLTRFADNWIDVTAVNLDGALVEFDGCVWPSSNSNTFNTSVNAHASTVIWRPNNMKLDGTPFDSGVNPQWDIAATRTLNLKFGGTTKVSFDGNHGVSTFGGAGADTFASLGPLTSRETSVSALWLVTNGTALTQNNAAMTQDGGNLYIMNYASTSGVFFGSHGYTGTFQAKFGANNTAIIGSDVVTNPQFYFDYSSATVAILGFTVKNTGSAKIQYDAKVSDVATAALTIQGQNAWGSAVTNKTGGSIFLTPGSGTTATDTPGSVVISLPLGSSNQPTQHGQLVVQENGVVLARLGGYTPLQTYGILWLKDGGSPSNLNYCLLSDSSALYINSPSGAGEHVYTIGGANYYSSLNASRQAWGAGTYNTYMYQMDFSATAIFHFTINATSAAIQYDAKTTDVATLPITIIPQAPYASATGSNRDSGDITINLPASVGGVTTKNGGFRVQYNGTDVARMGVLSGTVFNTYGTVGALWLGSFANAPTATNASLMANNNYTYINGGIAGIFFYGANTSGPNALLDGNSLLLGSVYSLPNFKVDFVAATIWHFGTGASTSATIKYDANASGAGNLLTIKGQDAFATSGLAGGDIVLTPGNGDGAGVAGKVQINTTAISSTIGTKVLLLTNNAIGGTGQPATQTQNSWLPIKLSDGTVAYLAVWK